MSGAQSIVLNPSVVAAVAAVCVGFAAFWSNPRRAINRVFFAASVHVATWLFLLNLAVTSEQGLYWLRITAAVGALLPLQLWLIKDTIVAATESSAKAILIRRWQWVLFVAILSVVPLTEWFIPGQTPQRSTVNQVYGAGFHLFYVFLVAVFLAVFSETIRDLRVQVGVRRLELQIVLLGGCAAAVAVLFLMGMRALLGWPWLIQLQPLVILLFYTGMVVAITTSRIFNARQIFLVAVQKVTLVTIIAGVAWLLDKIMAPVVQEPFAILGTTGIALWFASLLNSWLDQLFHFYSQATAARQAAFSAAQRETRTENLERAFDRILRGWGQSENTLILSGNHEALSGGHLELQGDSPMIRAMRQLRWATPERLERERSSSERQALKQFFTDHRLGVVVLEEGPALTVLLGVGLAASRRPFSYPQVTQLQELASIMEAALERAHFSAKVQHAEQLATVGLLGASLAHEIRNPLVAIKTFVQLLPTHYQDPAFREKFFRLIGEEVGRIDELTEQLLDLASPRTYAAQVIELHPVLRASLDLVAAKAAHKNVQFLTEFNASPDSAFTDASAAKQVMLNLCFNAIQAAESGEGEERWVKIATRNTSAGIEMAVADSGLGVAPEIRPRLFQPFQTTKSTGFGLGLAICTDILANLNASISVDPPAAGHGATFRVTFPCQPLSS